MEIMIKDGFMNIALIILISACVIGVLSVKFLGNDNPVEEASEEIVENQAERLLDLKNDELEGKIDFSYKSKEEK